ncbi:hypothetical protein GCM10009765_32630 [Fodinicola feengrottensis]|uniref:Uncharacterized protein n=1 Tax=Fodinicola feengrottensis TaxID=435914 RepID=A0ABP4T3C0_9ACTN
MQRHYLGGPLSPRGVRNAFLKSHQDVDLADPAQGLNQWYRQLSQTAKSQHDIHWFSATGYAYTLARTDTQRVQLLLEKVMEGLMNS